MKSFDWEFCAECGSQKPFEESDYRLCPDCREDVDCDEDWFR